MSVAIAQAIAEVREMSRPAPANGPARAAKRAGAPLDRNALSQRRCTDLGNAERLVDRHGKNLRYCADVGRLVWDSSKWVVDRTGAWNRCAAETARAIYAEAAKVDDADARKAIVKWATTSESRQHLEAMAKLGETIDGVAVSPEQLDADPFLLNVRNGTIDLRSGTLRQHSREDLLTKIAGTDYDADASCPVFESFLLSVFAGDVELVSFVRRFIGYCLTGDVREQVLLFCFGQGANGKSTFIETIVAMLCDYAHPGAPGLLIARANEQHATELADLRGARLVTCVEIGDGKRFDEERVKSLTGGDRIKARFMRENFFTFAPTHKLLLSANHKPTVRGTDLAIWRRILLLPFGVTFTDAQKDRALPEKLRCELPGILRWAVQGCLEWQREGLRPPAVVLQATEGYRAEQDSVGRFIADRCAIIPSARAKSGDLYAAFRTWCKDTGEHEISQRRLAAALEERGLKQVRQHGGVRAWQGIGLLADQAEESRWIS